MVKTYIRAPNWTTAPPPEGPIKLGHLLSRLDEFSPINRDDIFPISKENPVDVKEGCVLNFGRALEGELGIFAKFMALSGCGFDASIRGGKENHTELSFEAFETMSFNADDRYVEDSMATRSVKSYMEQNNYKKPVYLVTGLKIGRKSSMISSQSMSVGGSVEVGFAVTPAPVELGPRLCFSRLSSGAMSYKTSSDFIFAFQVRKIKYRKGQFTHKTYKRKAEYHGDNGQAKLGDACENKGVMLEVSERVSVFDFKNCTEIWEQRDTQDEDSDEILWVLPNKL